MSRPHNTYFSHQGRESGDDDMDDDLDRAIANQISRGGGKYEDNRATVEAAMLLRNHNVNMGLPDQQHFLHNNTALQNQEYLFQYNLGADADAYAKQIGR